MANLQLKKWAIREADCPYCATKAGTNCRFATGYQMHPCKTHAKRIVNAIRPAQERYYVIKP